MRRLNQRIKEWGDHHPYVFVSAMLLVGIALNCLSTYWSRHSHPFKNGDADMRGFKLGMCVWIGICIGWLFGRYQRQRDKIRLAQLLDGPFSPPRRTPLSK